MNPLRLLVALLLAAAIAWPLPVRAQQGDGGFIQLLVNDKLAVPVFPVLMEAGETPFLQFDALMRAIEVPVRFDPSLGAALGFLADGTTRFELNLKRGTVLVGEETFPLPAEAWRLVNQTLYVRHSELPHWIPLELEWSLEAYQVRISTQYPLPSTLREKRAALHRALEQSRTEAPTDAELQREVPWFDPGMFEFNSSASGGHNAPEQLQLNLKGVQRFLKGDLDYSVSQSTIDREAQRPLVDYSRLTYYNPQHTWQVQLGDTYSGFSPLLLDPVSFRGGSFYTGGQQLRFGRAQLIGTAPPGSEVDLYRQGVLLDFTTADARGFYRFPNVPLTLDRNLFELQTFTPDGRRLVEFKEVAGQEEMVGAGSLSTLGGAGRGEQGLTRFDVSAGEVRYGLLPALTLGGYALKLHNYFAEYETVPDIDAVGVFALVRAAPWLVLLGEQARDSTVPGSGTRVGAFLAFAPLVLQLEQRTYSEQFAPPKRTRSAFFSQPDRADTVTSVQARTRLLETNLSLESVLSDFGQSRRLTDHLLRLDRRLSANLSAFLTLETDRSSEPGYPTGGFDSRELLATYRLSSVERLEGFGFSRSDLLGPGASEARLSWLRNALVGSPWSWELSYIARRPDRDLGVVGLGYLFARNWRVSGRAQSDGTWLVQVDFTQPFRATGQGFERLPEGTFGRAGLEGDVYVDANANGRRDPGEGGASDVRLLAPGLPNLRSDSAGHFRGWGLLAGTPVPVDVDLLSTDALYTPARKHSYVAPRPGENVRLELALVPSSGMDGSLRFGAKGSVSPADGLELVLRRADGSVEARTTAEWDGAFIFERVAPGVYVLEGDPAQLAERGLALQPARVELTFPPGPDPTWPRGVDVQLVRTGPPRPAQPAPPVPPRQP